MTNTCDDCCLLQAVSADGEGNCKLSEVRTRTRFVPRLQMQGAGATDGVALLLRAAGLPAWSSSACTSSTHKEKSLARPYTHASRTRCGSDRGKVG